MIYLSQRHLPAGYRENGNSKIRIKSPKAWGNGAYVKIISPTSRGSGSYVVHKALERHMPGYHVSGYNPYWSVAPFMLKKIAPVKSADLIHAPSDYAIFSYRKDVPLVISFHGYACDRWIKPYSTLIQYVHSRTDLRLWFKVAVQKASAVTAVSQFTADLARRDLGIKRSVELIYNGVDTERFTPGIETLSNRKEVRVFFSGNLTRRKGVHWLPEIADHLEEKIRIYYTQGLRTRHLLPSHRGLKTVGPIPYAQMPNRYKQMDILVMPTVREGFGLSIAEAMSCGLPVVASDCSAIPELVDDGLGGFLCPIGDVDSFAQKINLLANSPQLRKEMGEYNRAKVEKLFTVERMVAKYQRLFDRVAESK